MPYLDIGRLAAIDAGAFRATKPYPWFKAAGVLIEGDYTRLREE